MSEIKTNKISSLDSSNSDITLDPDGTGDVVVSGATLTANTTDNFPITWQGASGGATGALYGDGSAVGMFNGAAFTTGVWANTSNEVYIRNNGSNTVKIDSSGNVGIGTSSPTIASSGGGVHIQDGTQAALRLDHFGSGGFELQSSSSNLMFYSTAASAERMRIDSSGKVLMGKTSSGQAISGFEYEGANGALLMTRDNARPALLNRGGNDGIIIDLRGQGQTEGTISVSGTTVSYNGGHLSRWSQATDGNRIDGLVKGTVMTNLDQMAEWTKDGVTEDNEQLNCMAVSSVEGDANVAGVFVNWDDDDEDYTADMNIAMTGDMVIRIASGTTVARGDLLMSAGDGTAKPQGDDIVRSKTIAKVTSTTVSHTYDDGSYLVPCVLMAC